MLNAVRCIITCHKCLKQYFGKEWACLDRDGKTIKVILGNLKENRTVCKDTFPNIFNYRVILSFCKTSICFFIDKADPRIPTTREDYWIHTLQRQAPMGLNVEGSY